MTFVTNNKFVINGTPQLRRGWRGRYDAFKWLFTGKSPIPYLFIPINASSIIIECFGGGGSGGGGIDMIKPTDASK